MNEQLRDPREDISYIRSILEKAADGMKTVAPWFTRFGVLWLVYGVLCAALQIVMTNVSLTAAASLSIANGALGWLFYIVLAVGFFAARRKQKRSGLDTLALKLVDMWGACILVFLFLSVVLVIVSVLAIRWLGLGLEAAASISYTLSACRSFLIFLLPLLPLLVTALFLENRRMLWAGIVLAVLAAAFLGSHIVLLWGSGLSGLEVSPAWVGGWNAAACVLDIIPGVMLLLFARSLKRG